MAMLGEARQFSPITPLQSEAWELEHEAIGFKMSGQVAVAESYMEAARHLRGDEIHDQLNRMDARSQIQNTAIDMGLGIVQREQNIVIESIPMQQGVDYTLMQQ